MARKRVGRPANHKGTPQSAEHRAQVAERRALAIELKQRGASFTVIADVIKQRLPHTSPAYDSQRAYDDVIVVLQQWQARAFKAAEPLRELQLARLEQLHLAHYQAALQGDNDAFSKVLRVYEREARLMGLDKADQNNATSLPLPEVYRRSLLLLRVVQQWWEELAPSQEAYVAGLQLLDQRIQAAAQVLGLPPGTQETPAP